MALETHTAAEFLNPGEPAPQGTDTPPGDTQEPVETGDTQERALALPEVDPVTGLALDELRKGYLRQRDYTRKREVEAEEKKRLAEEVNDLRTQLATYGPTKAAIDQLNAIYQANPQAQAELESIFARYGSVPQAATSRGMDPETKKRFEALEAQLRARDEELNASLSEDAVNYGMEKFKLTREQAYQVLERMGDEEAPILPQKRTIPAMRKCFETAYRDLHFARAQTTGQQAMLDQRAQAARAATVRGGSAPPPPSAPVRPRSWDEAEEIALQQLRRNPGA